MFLLLLPLLGAGCASPAMKGTPFYTGEYAKRQGPAEDRVNLWPLVYYRDPALSVLWPIFEHTDTHAAVRPVYSVYGLDQSNRVYNVLWPLAQFDRQAHVNRFFPVFWGDDYRVVFPLYWHFTEHTGTDGADVLFPLWSYQRHDADFSLYCFPLWYYSRHNTDFNLCCPWPFVGVSREGDGRGWYFWPLAGNFARGDGVYRYAAWPLMHLWRAPDRGSAGHTVLPLYWYSRDTGGSLFCSLPWWSQSDVDGTGWQCLPPLFFRRANPDGSTILTPLWLQRSTPDGRGSWQALLPLFYHSHGGTLLSLPYMHWAASAARTHTVIPPLLAWHTAQSDGHDTWLAGPLIHSRRDAAGSAQHVLPLFYTASDSNGSTFVSLPWSSSSDPAGNYWRLLPPLFFQSGGADRGTLITPLWAQGHSATAEWQTLIPLYYHRTNADGRVLATLLGGYRVDAEGQHWLVYPLLSWGARTRDGGEFWALAPLAHARWGADGKASHVLPFYYADSRNHAFFSLPWSRWGTDGKQAVLVPPALSWYTRAPERDDLWVAGGLAHWSWGREGGVSHVLPLYYRDPRSHAFFSLPWSRWGTDGKQSVLIPPALSWYTRTPERSDLWLAAALAHWSWGPQAGARHILPLFYSDPAAGTQLSPLWLSWKDGEQQTTVIPLALAQTARRGDDREFWAALGLFHQTHDRQGVRNGRLIPLYTYDRDDRSFLSPLCGWQRGERGWVYPATPLAGLLTGRDHSGFWLFPLCSHVRDAASGERSDWFLWGHYATEGATRRSHFFPLYTYHNNGPLETVPKDGEHFGSFGKDFFCLPYCWYRNQSTVRPAAAANAAAPLVRDYRRAHGVFPLWSYASARTAGPDSRKVNAAVLGLLYDYRREVAPGAPGTNDYARSRVLWRLWHYERLNGDASLDVFPGFTYDRKADGFKQVSFLWRFFRYERDAEGGRKLDLLFIPFMR